MTKNRNPCRLIPIVTGAALLALSACAGGPSGSYFGTMSTQTGVCGLSASPDGTISASLTIRGDSVLFSPEQGVLSLDGHIDPSGHLIAADNQPGADHKPFAMVFEGDLHGTTITGQYATPRCRASVSLARH